MSKAFSLISKNENILYLSKDKITRLYIEEYVKKERIYNLETVKKNIISIIVLDQISDLENIYLDKIIFTNKLTVYIKKTSILATSFLTIKYFQDELGYVKSLGNDEYQKYRIIYFKRNKSKILYLSN